jgi:hypothetical protein
MFGAEIGIIWADDADLQAIYTFVENTRPNITQFPKLQPLIEDFERWYQGLTWFDVHVMINDTIAEAVRRRNQINAAQNAFLDPTIVPGDLAGHTSFDNTLLPGPKPPLIPTQYKVYATVGAGILAGLVVLKKLMLI